MTPRSMPRLTKNGPSSVRPVSITTRMSPSVRPLRNGPLNLRSVKRLGRAVHLDLDVELGIVVGRGKVGQLGEQLRRGGQRAAHVPRRATDLLRRRPGLAPAVLGDALRRRQVALADPFVTARPAGRPPSRRCRPRRPPPRSRPSPLARATSTVDGPEEQVAERRARWPRARRRCRRRRPVRVRGRRCGRRGAASTGGGR